MIEKPRLIATQTICQHGSVQIVQDTLDVSGASQTYFYLASQVASVATVGVTAENQILLTRQYRHPIEQVIYDLPGGGLARGEDPMTGARREFEEETGFYPRHIEPLGMYNQFPGTLRAITHLYFARDLQKSQQNLDRFEVLELVPKPVGEVLEMIENGVFIDGSVQLGVLLALRKGFIHE